jgi:lipopolysaccharide/colanic/teichoic acid biosynthesis glycosyltransferase
MSLPQLAPGRAPPALALPLADLAALICAAAVIGPGGWRAGLWIACAWAVLVPGGLHLLPVGLRLCDRAGRVAGAVAASVGCVLPWTPAGLAGRLAVLAVVLVLAFRAMAMAGLRAAHRCGWFIMPTLLVGGDGTARRLAALLRDHPELGLRPVGCLVHGPHVAALRAPVPGLGADGLPILGWLADLEAVVAGHRISRVIVCSGAVRHEDLAQAPRTCRALGADLYAVPRLDELGAAVPRKYLDGVLGIPLLPLTGYRRLVARLALKRAFDMVAAAALLLLALPLLILLAAVSWLELRRPALFRQVRVVGSGRLAEIVKLRTLAGHGDPDTYWAPAKRQCTRFGWILRASHLDELPQLVNVLRGEMSLVGPRPERPYFARQFAQQIPGYGGRQRMPAGMTGWAQVHGLNGDTSIHDRVRFDNSYIECWSFWLDLVILARTIPAAVAGAFHLGVSSPSAAAPATATAAVPAADTSDSPAVLPSSGQLAAGPARGGRQ